MDKEYRDIALEDPLKDVTRKERKFLLATSLIGIGVVRTGLVPSKISALGIEFTSANQYSILSIFSLVVLYFLVAFIIYAFSDFLIWRRSLRRQRQEFALEGARFKKMKNFTVDDLPTEEELAVYRKPNGLFLVSYWNPIPVSIIRAIFEFLLPIIIGIIAIYFLIFGYKPIGT